MRRLLTFFAAAALMPPVALAHEYQGPECAQVRAEAPYQAYGYTHIVAIDNHCEAPVRCRVATNVDPEWRALRVPAGETGQVVTRRGSPASEFEARARCTEE